MLSWWDLGGFGWNILGLGFGFVDGVDIILVFVVKFGCGFWVGILWVSRVLVFLVELVGFWF